MYVTVRSARHPAPTVQWDGLDEEGRTECERVIRTRKDWVVLSRARPMKGDCTPRGFELLGKTVFCGKANLSKKEQGEPEAGKGIEDEAPRSGVNVRGHVRRQKGWWKRGVVETKSNMTAWTHTECDIMDEDALLRLHGTWENPNMQELGGWPACDVWVYWWVGSNRDGWVECEVWADRWVEGEGKGGV